MEYYLILSEVYLELGYTGRSALALGLAKPFLSKMNQEDQDLFYLAYSNYLLAIRNIEKFNSFCHKVNTVELDTNMAYKNILEAEKYLQCGQFDSALTTALSAHKYFLKKLNRSNQVPPCDFATYIKLGMRSILAVARAYFLRGEAAPTEYFLKQGLEISKRFDLNFHSLLFTFELARFLQSRGHFSNANEILVELEKSMQTETNDDPKTVTELHSSKADILSHLMQNLDLAESEYRTAADIVEEFILSPMFSDFDEELLLNAESSKTNKGASELLPKCIGLQSIKSSILCRYGGLLLHRGEVMKAEKRLLEAAKLPLEGIDQGRYLSLISRIKLDLLLRKSFPSSKLDMYQESVIALFDDESLIGSKTKVNQSVQKAANQLEGFMIDGFDKSITNGLPVQTTQLATCLVELKFACKYLGYPIGEISSAVADLIYRLETPKSIFTNRQMAHSAASPQVFSETLLQVPDSIICLALNLDANRNMIYVSHVEEGKKMIMRLPLARMATRDGSLDGSGFIYSEARTEFDQIMTENKSSTTNAKNCITAHDRRKWYQDRVRLDQTLESFLTKMETNWFGGFKGIFSGMSLSSDHNLHLLHFKERIENFVFKQVCRCQKKKPTKVNYSFQLCKILVRGGLNPSYEEVEDVLYFLIDSYQSKGSQIALDEMDIDEMREDYLDAVKLFYKESGLQPTFSSNKHIVLILDKQISDLPWECIPILNGKPVSRLPSWNHLNMSLQSAKVKVADIFTVLNPSGDLVKTQEKFEKYLPLKSLKNGIVARQPTKEEIIRGLQNASLFLYFGHGGGESYLAAQDFEKTENLPVALLFGCSSGSLKCNGELDSHGVSLQYLKHGSPAVMGNLWDVTDVDLDRFAMEMLDRWGLQAVAPSSISLSQAIAQSRKVCKLKYLVGAAPIVYGLPVYLLE
jgi:separase